MAFDLVLANNQSITLCNSLNFSGPFKLNS